MAGLTEDEMTLLKREVSRLAEVLDANKAPEIAFILIATRIRQTNEGIRLQGQAVCNTDLMDDPTVATFCETVARRLRGGAERTS